MLCIPAAIYYCPISWGLNSTNFADLSTIWNCFRSHIGSSLIYIFVCVYLFVFAGYQSLVQNRSRRDADGPSKKSIKYRNRKKWEVGGESLLPLFFYGSSRMRWKKRETLTAISATHWTEGTKRRTQEINLKQINFLTHITQQQATGNRNPIFQAR